MAFIGIVTNKVTLWSLGYSACVVYTKTIIFTLVLVKVVDIFPHFGENMLNMTSLPSFVLYQPNFFNRKCKLKDKFPKYEV